MEYTVDTDELDTPADKNPILGEDVIDQALENIVLATEDLDDLLKYRKLVLESSTFSDVTKTFLKETLEGFYERYEFEKPINIATEAFDADTKSVALETIGEIFSKIWEAIKSTFKAIWDYISGVFNDTQAKAEKVNTRIEKVKEEITKVKSDPKFKQKEPVDYIEDQAILRGFGTFKGEVKPQDIQRFMVGLDKLTVNCVSVLKDLIDDTTTVQNFSAEVAGKITNKDFMTHVLSTMQNEIKLKSNDTVSHKFDSFGNVSEDVLKHAHLDAVDTKLTRIAYGLSHGKVIYFLKPLAPLSFYRAMTNLELPDKPLCKIKCFTINELEKLIEEKDITKAMATLNSETFTKDVEDLKKDQDKQAEIIDNIIKKLPDLKDDGVDEDTVRKVLQPVLNLHKQSAALANDLNRIVKGIADSAEFFSKLLSFMINKLKTDSKEINKETKDAK